MSGEYTIEVRNGLRVIASYQHSAKSPLSVGRGPECDVILPDPAVSRHHANFVFQPDAVRVFDLSRNGLTARGAAIPPGGSVPYGEVIHIGELSLVARSTGPSRPSIDRIKREIHLALIDRIDLSAIGEDPFALRSRVESAIERLVGDLQLSPDVDRERLIFEIVNEALGLGPLEELLSDDRFSEIMVVGPDAIFVEERGTLVRTEKRFSSASALRNAIDRILAPLGRRIDESSPAVDARLADGSRVHAIIPPLSLKGPCLTIRKFSRNPLTLRDLVKFGTLDDAMGELLVQAVRKRQNVVISGGTGSGKTTLLRILADQIPARERILTIEDAAELNLAKPHVVPLEARPQSAEGAGEVSIRELVRNALRMRPDRIVVGECRGGEALDMLQAMNTGHDGSLTTIHANSPAEAVTRLETLCLMAGIDLPPRAIREQIVGAVDLIIQQTRFGDGHRRVVDISEVTGLEPDGRVGIRQIYHYSAGPEGGDGRFTATGWLPEFLLRASLEMEAPCPL